MRERELKTGEGVCHRKFSTLFQQCLRDDCLLGKGNTNMAHFRKRESEKERERVVFSLSQTFTRGVPQLIVAISPNSFDAISP